LQPTSLDLEHFLPYRLSVLSNRISAAIAREYAERFQLGMTEWRVLAVIGPSPGLSASEVVERTAMDKVAVSRAVDRLVRSGRLLRETDGDDRRRSLLRLSPAGREVYAEVVPAALALERRLLEALSLTDREQLDELLGRLNEAADKL
jgi:DNA-binding MarR family transcriptional regulator